MSLTKTITTYLLGALILFTSCKSTTTIYSSVPDADVYIGGKYKGKTPYRHSDYLPTGLSKKVRIEKEGFEPYETKIRKLERVNGMALFGTMWFGLPILWTGAYDHIHHYDLKPENGEMIESNHFEFGNYFLTTKRKTPIYIDSDDNYHYIYKDGHLHTLNQDLSLNNTKELFKASEEIPLDAYTIGDMKRVVEYSETDELIKIHSISQAGQVITMEVRNILFYEYIFDMNFSHGYYRNETTNDFICYSHESVIAFNRDLDETKSIKTEKAILQARILSDGTIITLELDDEGTYICMRNDETQNYITIDEGDGLEHWGYRMNVEEEHNRLFVSSLSGMSPKENKYITGGCEIHSYELSTGSLLKTDIVPLSDQSKEKLRKGFLINRGVLYDGQNAFMHVEEQWLKTTTTTNTSDLSSRETQRYCTGNIFVVGIQPDKEAQQKIIYKYDQSIVYLHRDKLSYHVQLKDGLLYFVYNSSVAGRSMVHQLKLDSDLNVLTQNVINTWKEERTLFNASQAQEMKDGRLFFFTQYKTKLGGVIADF